MAEPKPQDSKPWAIVMITVAVIGCLGVIGAALIGALPEIIKTFSSPQPTSTAVVIFSPMPTQDSLGAVASTPEPNNPGLESSAEPTNISLPFPTESPIPNPTSTQVPDTSPGSILEVGDEWRQNGVEFRLTRYELYPEDSYGDNVGVGFEFWNYTNEDLIVSYTKSDFLATTGTGNPLLVKGFYNRSFWCNENTDLVKAGERYNIEDGAECGFNTLLYIDVDLSNPSITEVIVRVIRFSRITDARWRITLQR